MFPVFKNVGEGLLLKTTILLVFFLGLVKSLPFFLISSMVLGLLNLLAVVSDRIPVAFNRSGAIRAVALDISKAFHRVWHAGLHAGLLMLSVILLYMLMILLTTLWLLNLNLRHCGMGQEVVS